MADPERFDADPDPTFHADADPDPNFVQLESEQNFSLISSTIVFQNLTKLVKGNFLSKNDLIDKKHRYLF